MNPHEPFTLESAALFFNAFSIQPQLRVACLVSTFEVVTSSDLCKVFGTDDKEYFSSWMARHIRSLVESGVLMGQRAGQAKLYSLVPARAEFVRTLLRPLSDMSEARADAERYRKLLRQGKLIVDNYEGR